MKNRILSLLLALCLMVLALPMSVEAAETFTYKVSATTTTPSIGSEFEVVISLTNYDSLDAEIRGLQIDVTNIDTSVFEIVSHSTMISDTSAASNKTSYSSSKNYIRLVYLQLAGSMDKSVTDVMKFRLKVKSDLTEGGSITLPITLKIGTMSENITLNDSLTINYQEAATVDEAILYQTNENSTDIRLVAYVDSLEAYSKVSFKLTIDGKTSKELVCTTAYNGLYANGTPFTTEQIYGVEGYFVTYTINRYLDVYAGKEVTITVTYTKANGETVTVERTVTIGEIE